MSTRELQANKKALRQRMRLARRLVDGVERTRRGEELARRLMALPQLERLHCLLATLPMGGEIDTMPFCEQWAGAGKVLLLPKVEEEAELMSVWRLQGLEGWRPGYRDCPEPDVAVCQPWMLDQVEAILVPGLAFDRLGNRLGQGGGHYDRLLAVRKPGTLAIGICYEFQIVDRVPAIPEWDRPVDWIVTPEEAIEAGKETQDQ